MLTSGEVILTAVCTVVPSEPAAFGNAGELNPGESEYTKVWPASSCIVASSVPFPSIFVDSAATGNGLICEKGGPVLSMALRAAWMLVKVELSAKFWPKTQSFLMKSMLQARSITAISIGITQLVQLALGNSNGRSTGNIHAFLIIVFIN